MRRILVVAGLTALGLSLTVPAFAHNEQYVHEMAWASSPDSSGQPVPTTANDGSQVYSNDEVVAAKVNMVDGVRSWDVVLRPVNGGQPSTCHEDLAQQNGRYPQTVYINCPWDTTRATNHTLPGQTAGSDAGNVKFSRVWQAQDLGPSVNGKYTIEITAYNADNPCSLLCTHYPVEAHQLYQSGSNPPRWREVWVTNGVNAPTGVAASYDPGSNRISVTWAPNPEPDVTYIVQEKVGDGKWSAGASVPGNTTRYDRAIDQPGSYQYQVAAMRPAPTKDGSTATKKSDFVAASAVQIAQVAPPTTAGGTNGADSTAPDSGDPGVFLPGDTPGTTGPGGPPGSGPARPGPTSARGVSGPAAAFRPTGSAARPTGTTAGEPGEAEGEGPDGGFATTLPYQQPQEGLATDGGDEEAGPQTLAGGVVPKPHDTRNLLIYVAISLTLFVFAMQLTLLLRRSRPATLAAITSETYHDDFDDWLGGF